MEKRMIQLEEARFLPSNMLVAFLLVTVSLAVTLPGLAQEKRAMTADDCLNLTRTGNVLMAPDGNSVYYAQRKLNWEENKYDSAFYMVDSTGKNPRIIIGEKGGSDFKLSPDGKFLSFLRRHKEGEQLFLMNLRGGEAQQLSAHKGKIVNYRWSKENDYILFLAEEARPEKEEKEFKLGNDPIFVNEGPNGKNHGSWTNFWSIDIKSKKEKRLTKEKLLIDDFDISTTGRIVFSARKNNNGNTPFISELYLLDKKRKGIKKLTENLAMETNPLWSPTGEVFAYRASSDTSFDLRSGYFWTMNPDTGKVKKLLGQHTGEVDHINWAPDGNHLLYNEMQGTDENLFKLNVITDEVERLTNSTGILRALAYSQNQTKMVYSFEDFTTPGDLYFSDLAESSPVRLTDNNPWFRKEIALPQCKVICWKSNDGLEIEGTLYLPHDYKKGTRLPLILEIHGGPSGYWANMFEPELITYTGLGYAVLCPNVRGSSSYGDEILRGLIDEVGAGEYQDLISGVNLLINEDIVNPEQLGVAGWSWGGVSAGWVITQTNRFKAASVGAGVSSWISESGPGFNWDVAGWYLGGKHWTHRNLWQSKSAINFVEKVETPALFLHGGSDQTSSTNQSMVYFSALQERGIPTRFIKFPRQGHGIGEPRLRRVKIIEEIKWMQKYVRKIQWQPWERKNKTNKNKIEVKK